MTSSDGKPVFLLLHGAWHTPHVFSRLTPHLTASSYRFLTPQLPSTCTDPSIPPVSSWEPDLETIRSAVTQLARDQGLDVIVVMHSNSGLTGTQALEGLDKKSTAEKGWKGGVVRLIYVCAFMFGEGWTQCPQGTGTGLDPDITLSLSSGTYSVAPDKVKGLCYQDVSDEEGLEIAKTLHPQALAPLWCTSTYAAWRWIPTTFVVTLGDKPTTVGAEEWLISSAKESGTCAIDRVVRREVGHTPFWSQAEWTAGMLIEEAERTISSGE